LLVVNYPDISSSIAKLMGRRWVFLLSVHLYYFVPKTLADMLSRLGFDVVDRKKHWQSLELGYVLFRMEAYVKPIAKAIGKVVNALGLGHVQFPYWMGQVLVFAQKK
jgi:hypothetical protein